MISIFIRINPKFPFIFLKSEEFFKTSLTNQEPNSNENKYED